MVNYLQKIIKNFTTMAYSGWVTLISSDPHEIAKSRSYFFANPLFIYEFTKKRFITVHFSEIPPHQIFRICITRYIAVAKGPQMVDGYRIINTMSCFVEGASGSDSVDGVEPAESFKYEPAVVMYAYLA